MAYAINHIHVKADDPKRSADWWVQAFGFKIVTDTVRPGGDRLVGCESSNGIRVNISGARTGETLAPGDSGVHWGTEHFGLDSENLEHDIERIKGMGGRLLEGPIETPTGRFCFMGVPDHVRIELIQRKQP